MSDLEVTHEGRTLRMLGAGGAARELALLEHCEEWFGPASQGGAQTVLPVLLGTGVGFALDALVQALASRYGTHFRLVVVDKELPLLEASGCRERFAAFTGITWVHAPTVEAALRSITHEQQTVEGLALQALVHPFYLRLDRDFYAPLREACAASQKVNFWERMRYPRFAGAVPRVLLLTSKYFLMGEVIAACHRMGVPHRLVHLPEGETGSEEFVEELLRHVLEFQPDFVLTLNHLGVDREGVLSGLLERLQLPLASWFVDNPHLILHMYSRLVTPLTAIFTWDSDNLPSLKDMGFEHVFYLPLGVDHMRFCLPSKAQAPAPAAWRAPVSFVGNSMVYKVEARKEAGQFPPVLLERYKDVAAAFSESEERSVTAFLQAHFPAEGATYEALDTPERKLCYEAMLTWEATLQYRLSCVQGVLPFSPLIVGDDGWHSLLPQNGWRYATELNYYGDLPRFYPLSAVNFNCTSKQMKGAVNQRVFDVPATGAFLVTDFREQIANLFHLDKEVVCYHSPEEATELVAFYLKHEARRTQVAQAARKRILTDHTYEKRLEALFATMRKAFA